MAIVDHEKELIKAMNEISVRESHPDKFVWCENCKTRTKSVGGECAICFGGD